MAAPSYGSAAPGATDAGDAWTYTCSTGGIVAGSVIIVQIIQDGTTAGAISAVVGTKIYDLAGTNGVWTAVAVQTPVGSGTAALQHIYIGRWDGTTGSPIISGANSTSEDLYIRAYRFQDVSTGTTLATVIENATAGATVNSVGTSNTASDTGVQTLGSDRLALNFVAVNDDNAIAQFSGMSGGTWTEIAEYAESSGTDGAIQLQYCSMASAGTIDGGTASITDSDAWGVIGFALIGTTASYTTHTGSFAANAVIKKTLASTFTANAANKKTLTATFYIGNNDGTGGAVLTIPITTYTFTDKKADAVLFATITPVGGKKADAVLFKNSGTKTFTADAIVKRTMPIAGATFTANAIVRRTFTPTLTVNAVLKRTQNPTSTVDAIRKRTFYFGSGPDPR